MKSYDSTKPLRVLVLPDKLKGSLTALEVGQTITKAILEETKNWQVELIPVADGGDGSLKILLGNTFEELPVVCKGALGEVATRRIGIHQQHAFIELAEICGIGLLGPVELNPCKASSFGLGEALIQAVEYGAKEVTFSLGGSASIDGGFGLLCALGARGFDIEGRQVSADLNGLMQLASVDLTQIENIYQEITINTLVDVDNPLNGPFGAAFIYGPQKGLKKEELVTVDSALKSWANLLLKETGVDPSSIKGLGAAGGVPLVLVSLFKSEVISGSEWFMEHLNLKTEIHKADLIITTEGKFDSQSVMGKITGEIIKECERAGKDCVVIAGVIDHEESLSQSLGLISMSKLSGSFQLSLEEPKKWLTESIKMIFGINQQN